MKDNCALRNKDKITHIQLEGALKLEQKLVKILLSITIITFVLSGVIEYIIPIFVRESVLEMMHQQFLVNIFLGISCSALVSLIGIWIPFYSKKNEQQANLNLLVKSLFYAYEQVYTAIVHNGNRDETDNTYLGEMGLLEKNKELKDCVSSLVGDYQKSDICDESVEVIISKVNDVFIPISQLINNFIEITVLPEHKTNFETVSWALQKRIYNKEQNKDIYNQLIHSLEEVMHYEEVCKLFANYINPETVAMEILKINTGNLLEGFRIHDAQQRIFNITTLLNANLFKIIDECSQKRMEKDITVLQKIKKIEEKISFLPKNEQSQYHKELMTVYKYIKEQKWDMAEENINNIERKIKTSN